jgi:hypothetical protein
VYPCHTHSVIARLDLRFQTNPVTEQFYNKTIIDEKNSKTLKQLYLDGPVVDLSTHQPLKDKDGNPRVPYSKFLDSEIARLIQAINDAVPKRDEAYDRWVNFVSNCLQLLHLTYSQQDKNTAGAIATAPFGPIAWIGTGILTDRAIKARKEYDRLIAQIEKDRAERITTARLLTLVNSMIYQIDGLLPKMAKALDAMRELQELFRSQELNFQYIIQNLTAAEKGVKATALKWRKAWIERNLDKAVEKFEEVCFYSTILPFIIGFPVLSYSADTGFACQQIKETAQEFQKSAMVKKTE